VSTYARSWVLFVRWLIDVAPSERAFLEAFFLWIYTARAHNDHQRFQEVPDEWNPRVDAFWWEVEARS
jgi:hypothetical protein